MLDRKDHSHPKTPRDYLRLFLTGFAMGSADIVPGVSGGTMAFILGIYEDLLDAIKSFNLTTIRLALQLKFKEVLEHIPLQFLIVLGAGIGTAIVMLSGLLSSTLEDPTGRVYLFAFFFGLVVASIISVGAQIKWSAAVVGTLIAGAIAAFVIVNIVPAETSHDPIFLFLSGMVAICAMILPGISGSFILLVLGQYDYVLAAVGNRDFGTLIAVALGCVVGIVIFSRVLSWTLKRYYHVTVGALVGFMVGSLWKIWPWKECVSSDLDRHGDLRCLQEANLLPNFASEGFIIALLLVVAGFLLVSFIDHLQTDNNLVFSRFWRRRAREEALASE